MSLSICICNCEIGRRVGFQALTRTVLRIVFASVRQTFVAWIQILGKMERNLWRDAEIKALLDIIEKEKILNMINEKKFRNEQIFRFVESGNSPST